MSLPQLPLRLVGLVVALLVLAAGGATRAQDVPALTLAAAGNDSTTSALYAVKSGLFKKAGLDVNIIPMNSGSSIAAAVAGGAVQIGHSSLLSLIEAHAKHVPFTLVAASAMMDESDAKTVQLVVRKDAPIRTARDLNGKTFASPALKDFDAISVMAWMDKNGGDSSTLRFVELPPGAALQGVIDGRVDAVSLAAPILTQGLASGNIRELGNAFSAVAPRYMQLAWFTTADYATGHRDAIARFVQVMHEAALYCNAHQEETVTMIADFGRLDPAVVRSMPRMTFAPYLVAAMIQPLVDTAARYKAIDAPFNAQDLISPYALKAPLR